VRTAKTFSYTSQPFKLVAFAACKKAKGCSFPSPKGPRVYRQRTFRLSKLAVKCPVSGRIIGHSPGRKSTQGRSVIFLIPGIDAGRRLCPTFKTQEASDVIALVLRGCRKDEEHEAQQQGNRNSSKDGPHRVALIASSASWAQERPATRSKRLFQNTLGPIDARHANDSCGL
jgi:hypothetical protein